MVEKKNGPVQTKKLISTTKAAPIAPVPNGESIATRNLYQDQYEGPPATTKEVAAYYAYYAGNNGIGSFQ